MKKHGDTWRVHWGRHRPSNCKRATISRSEGTTMPAVTKSSTTQKTQRADGQITGLAGELFVAAELLKRGLQTSVTFGNAKAIDLLAFNPATEKTFTVQ